MSSITSSSITSSDRSSSAQSRSFSLSDGSSTTLSRSRCSSNTPTSLSPQTVYSPISDTRSAIYSHRDRRASLTPYSSSTVEYNVDQPQTYQTVTHSVIVETIIPEEGVLGETVTISGIKRPFGSNILSGLKKAMLNPTSLAHRRHKAKQLENQSHSVVGLPIARLPNSNYQVNRSSVGTPNPSPFLSGNNSPHICCYGQCGRMPPSPWILPNGQPSIAPTSASEGGNDSVYEQEFLGYPRQKFEALSKETDHPPQDELEERIKGISSEERVRIAPWMSDSSPVLSDANMLQGRYLDRRNPQMPEKSSSMSSVPRSTPVIPQLNSAFADDLRRGSITGYCAIHSSPTSNGPSGTRGVPR